MFFYKINYYHNTFFIINNNFYVYIKPSDNSYVYIFDIIDNILFLKIDGKNTNKSENFYIKIIKNNNYCEVDIKNIKKNYIKIGNINNFILNTKFCLTNDFINFDKEYYIKNNKFIDKLYINNKKYIDYHWVLCGQYHPYLYFKYLLKKYENIIFNINYTKIQYNIDKNNTLLFIDDRYDPSFIYLLILFCYSIDESWNIIVFTVENNVNKYKNDFDKIGITGKIELLENKFNNSNDYSNLLKKENFWKRIKEDNVLIFQYDSFCMGKFNNHFFNYNYIGARWPHNACKYKDIKVGNGGTSFRKTRVMENICKKNNKKNNIAEDVFLCQLLYENNLHNCTIEIADKFAFENIFNEYSIYAHQIYNSIELSAMDNFMYKKLVSLISILKMDSK
jgi:hypothetical protein